MCAVKRCGQEKCRGKSRTQGARRGESKSERVKGDRSLGRQRVQIGSSHSRAQRDERVDEALAKVSLRTQSAHIRETPQTQAGTRPQRSSSATRSTQLRGRTHAR
eukprot:6185354-Pleurochrysis_carterae.AAC.1